MANTSTREHKIYLAITDDDRAVIPETANREEKYRCAECKGKVIFCHGDVRQPYFRHDVLHTSSPCSYGKGEGIVHKRAKLLFAHHLDRWDVIRFCSICRGILVLQKPFLGLVGQLEVPVCSNRYRVDVMLSGGIVVEITDTHALTTDKIQALNAVYDHIYDFRATDILNNVAVNQFRITDAYPRFLCCAECEPVLYRLETAISQFAAFGHCRYCTASSLLDVEEGKIEYQPGVTGKMTMIKAGSYEFAYQPLKQGILQTNRPTTCDNCSLLLAENFSLYRIVSVCIDCGKKELQPNNGSVSSGADITNIFKGDHVRLRDGTEWYLSTARQELCKQETNNRYVCLSCSEFRKRFEDSDGKNVLVVYTCPNRRRYCTTEERMMHVMLVAGDRLKIDGTLHRRRDTTWNERDRYLQVSKICKNCNSCRCNRCGKRKDKTQGKWTAYRQWFCNPCLAWKSKRKCSHCHKWAHKDEGTQVERFEWICHPCTGRLAAATGNP